MHEVPQIFRISHYLPTAERCYLVPPHPAWLTAQCHSITKACGIDRTYMHLLLVSTALLIFRAAVENFAIRSRLFLLSLSRATFTKMGNLCSKSANQDDQFSTPGRVLGSSSQTQPTSAPVPQKITSSTPGRVVGGTGANSGGDDPRSAAARAAEVCRMH
jgi:hypothetical protein